MRRALVALVLCTFGAACAPPVAAPRAERAPDPPRAAFRPVQFPLDESPHNNLTEWWYYTGHLFTEAGERYGFEFVIFQVVRGDNPVAYFAHMAVTDGPRGRFWHDQRGQLGSQIGKRDGFDLDVRGWQLTGALGHDAIQARTEAYGLDLQLTAAKPPALHEGRGYISFGPVGDSYYSSRTRLAVEGALYDGERRVPVRGQAWMDHQWGDFLVLGGWDWYSLQLDDETEVMLFVTRAPDGGPGLTLGTYVAADGASRDLAAADFDVSPTGTWTSPHTGAVYPSGWEARVPALGLELDLVPTLVDQELVATATTGLAYWEGQVEVRGRRGAEPLAGLGYVELTGYAPNQPRTASTSSRAATSASAASP
jgi:predicted secreted hydrolase